jgi:hypothetical protein
MTDRLVLFEPPLTAKKRAGADSPLTVVTHPCRCDGHQGARRPEAILVLANPTKSSVEFQDPSFRIPRGKGPGLT